MHLLLRPRLRDMAIACLAFLAGNGNTAPLPTTPPDTQTPGINELRQPAEQDPRLDYLVPVFPGHAQPAGAVRVDPSDGRIYVAAGSFIEKRTADGGTVIWRVNTIPATEAGVVHDLELVNGNLFAALSLPSNGPSRGALVKLASSDGRVSWRSYSTRPRRSVAVQDDGTAFVTSDEAVDAISPGGSTQWQWSLPHVRPESIALAPGNALAVAATDRAAPGGTDINLISLSRTGTLLRRSAFGGTGDESPSDIVVHHDDAFIVGTTQSTDFALVGSLGNQAPCLPVCTDVVVLQIALAGHAQRFGTLLSGDGQDHGHRIAVDAEDNVYVTGAAAFGFGATPFPLLRHFAGPIGATELDEDTFLTRLIPFGGSYAIHFSTMLGQPTDDFAWGMDLHDGNVYLGGYRAVGGSGDGYLARVGQAGAPPLPTAMRFNFQGVGEPVPGGFIADVGAAYGMQGPATFGWISGELFAGRSSHPQAEPALQTYLYSFGTGSSSPPTWELALPNGRYDVRIGSTAPDVFAWPINQFLRIYAEEIPIVKGGYSRDGDSVIGSAPVHVADGRLTIRWNHRTEPATSLAFVEVSPSTAPNAAPQVSLSAPLASRSTFHANRPLTLHADASDSDGRIREVRFYTVTSAGRRSLIGRDSTAPYALNWGCEGNSLQCAGVPAGDYRIVVEAEDQEGATGISTVRSLAVRPLDPARRLLTFTLRAFIPFEYVDLENVPAPWRWGFVAHGDDRSFSTTSPSYRVAQTFTVDVSDRSDPILVSSTAGAGTTIHYDTVTSLHPATGRLTAEAKAEPLRELWKGPPFMLDYARADASSETDIRGAVFAPGTLTVSLFGHAKEPLVFEACAIDWKLDVTIDTRDPALNIVQVNGSHDRFPQFELYADDQPLLLYQVEKDASPHELCKESIPTSNVRLPLR
ncbi:MAG: hypothetical protein AMXMBFR59_07430 [Rhodanobacteraceae bacterium]